jgi:hypothetical protein
MQWNEVEAVLPAVFSRPDRAESVQNLLIRLAQQCPGITVRIVPQWPKNPDPRAAFEAIAAGLAHLYHPWVLYLEDDCQLSSRFGAEALLDLEQAAENWGAISFFSAGPQDAQLVARKKRFYPAGNPFILSQCVLMRWVVAQEWGDGLLEWWAAASEGRQKAPDIALGEAAGRLGMQIMVRVPNLAQHRAIPSVFGHTNPRISRTFVP